MTGSISKIRIIMIQGVKASLSKAKQGAFPLLPPAGAEPGAGGKNAYSKWPVVTTELEPSPAATVAGVMAVKAPSVPIVYWETLSLLQFATYA